MGKPASFPPPWEATGATSFAAGIGLGILAYTTLALALLGAIYPWTLILLLGLLALAARHELTHLFRLLREAWASRKPLSLFEKCITVLLLTLLLLSLLRALTPPTDYDGLMYHLTAPQTFLREHRLVSFTHNPGVNFPATPEMLYTIALGLGSPMAAKVLHLSFALLTTLALFCLARHFLSREAAWLTMAVLWSIPIFVTEAGWAYVDLVWTFYETLAIFAFLFWAQQLNRGWLILSALLMGFALGTKYLALYGFLLLVVAIATVGWMARNKRGLQGVAKDLVLFGVVSGLVASPWYLKNWLWLGNPVYPFFIGGLNYDLHRVEATAYMARNRGLGHCLRCYLLLPWNIYAHSEYFGHVHPAWPSPLYLFLPLWVLWRKNRFANLLLALSFFRFALWAVSTQDLRYLLPIYPALSVATGYILHQGVVHWRRLPWDFFVRALVISLLLINVWLQLYKEAMASGNPLPVILGIESQTAYLSHSLIDYPATRFINEKLPLDAKVLFIGDARGYYLQRQYIPDTTIHLWWGYLVPVGGSLEGILAQLREWGVSHILYSEGGVEWVSQWDPEGKTKRGVELFASFKEQYLVELYKDNAQFHVYRIVY